MADFPDRYDWNGQLTLVRTVALQFKLLLLISQDWSEERSGLSRNLHNSIE